MEPWTNRGTSIYFRRTDVFCRGTAVFCGGSGYLIAGRENRIEIGKKYIDIYIYILKEKIYSY